MNYEPGRYCITRYHDFSAGHRVVGHEGKCRLLHGHNYRVHFACAPKGELDNVGRVVDFGVIKSRLCNWLEENWDHKMLIWNQDREVERLLLAPHTDLIEDSVVWVPFNPTAENMAEHLFKIGNQLLKDYDVELVGVNVEETRKCAASFWGS